MIDEESVSKNESIFQTRDDSFSTSAPLTEATKKQDGSPTIGQTK